jgi:hypothetical protein
LEHTKCMLHILPVAWQTFYFSPPLVHELSSKKWTTRDRCHRQDSSTCCMDGH